jgi:hypothetical protein
MVAGQEARDRQFIARRKHIDPSPSKGTIIGGWEFQGGDSNDPNDWKMVGEVGIPLPQDIDRQIVDSKKVPELPGGGNFQTSSTLRDEREGTGGGDPQEDPFAPVEGRPSALRLDEMPLAGVENSVRAGWVKSEQKWVPHSSLEGGSDTLAYGHKLTPSEVKSGKVKIAGESVDFKKGITEGQAVDLFRQDVAKAEEGLSKRVTDFEGLPEKYRQILVSIQFNTGNVSEKTWPKLLAAMRAGDDATVRQEMVTSFADEQGNRTPLEKRATAIANSVGLGD